MKQLSDFDFIFLGQDFHEELRSLGPIRWVFISSDQEFQAHLQRVKKEVFVVIQMQTFTFKHLKSLEVISRRHLKCHFIVMSQVVDSACYPVLAHLPNIYLYARWSAMSLKSFVHRCIDGLWKNRRQERRPVASDVMIKRSGFSQMSPIGEGVQFLREGKMEDFSATGARLSLSAGGVELKDFLNLMYKNQHGIWVSVESQVRWVQAQKNGEISFGVQFLAVNA